MITRFTYYHQTLPNKMALYYAKKALQAVGLMSRKPSLYKYLKACAVEQRDPRRVKWAKTDYNNGNVTNDKEFIKQYIMLALGDNDTLNHTAKANEFLSEFYINLDKNLYVNQERNQSCMRNAKHQSSIEYMVKHNGIEQKIQFTIVFRQKPLSEPESTDKIVITYTSAKEKDHTESKTHDPFSMKKEVSVYSDVIMNLPNVYE